MKITKYILGFLLLICLASCYDNNEPNDLAYATAIGIDKGDSENFNITIQFAKPHNISGGENGGTGKDILGCITVEAPNIYAAIGLGNHVISKSIDMSHLQLFLFSQEVAEEGIHNFIETISRSKEIRPNVYTAVCKDKASDYLKNATPVVDINPSKYYQLIFGKSDFRAIPQSFSQDLYFYMKLPEKNSVIPLTGVGEEKSSDSKEEQSSGQESQDNKENTLLKSAPFNKATFQYSMRDYEAGEIEVYSQSKGEVIGSSVFKGDKMIGSLGLIETQIYNYLVGDKSKNYVSFKTDKSTSPITVLLGIDKKTKIFYDKKNHHCDVYLDFTADFVSLPDDYIAEQDIDYFQATSEKALSAAAKRFITRTQTEFDSDIVGFGLAARKEYKTSKEFKQFDWDKKYKTMSFDVKSDVQVRRTGLTIRTD